jgi:hypothetical protein
MVDVDPFLTTLYVMVDDFCKASLPTESPQAHTRRSVAVRCSRWRSLGRGRSVAVSAALGSSIVTTTVSTLPAATL